MVLTSLAISGVASLLGDRVAEGRRHAALALWTPLSLAWRLQAHTPVKERQIKKLLNFILYNKKLNAKKKLEIKALNEILNDVKVFFCAYNQFNY